MAKRKNKKQPQASIILGILSIFFGFTAPLIGLILGIIGVSVKKDETHYTFDVIINVVGICISIIATMILI